MSERRVVEHGENGLTWIVIFPSDPDSDEPPRAAIVDARLAREYTQGHTYPDTPTNREDPTQ